MIQLEIPGIGLIEINNLMLDLNGTIALDGKLLPGVKDRIKRLSRVLEIYLVTCDTHGNASQIAESLGIKVECVSSNDVVDEALSKANFLKLLGPSHTSSIGNGNSDVLMLRNSNLSIAVLGKEGLSVNAALQADIIVKDIRDALDLFLIEKRLVSSLRGYYNPKSTI
jgi:soluble P-type ATPase